MKIDWSRHSPANDVERRWLAFHQLHPGVYRALAALALEAVAAGGTQLRIDELHSVATYQARLAGRRFTMNNNHRPYYARLLMLQEPKLAGRFAVRAMQQLSTVDAMYLGVIARRTKGSE